MFFNFFVKRRLKNEERQTKVNVEEGGVGEVVECEGKEVWRV